jgi:hypothetical protein
MGLSSGFVCRTTVRRSRTTDLRNRVVWFNVISGPLHRQQIYASAYNIQEEPRFSDVKIKFAGRIMFITNTSVEPPPATYYSTIIFILPTASFSILLFRTLCCFSTLHFIHAHVSTQFNNWFKAKRISTGAGNQIRTFSQEYQEGNSQKPINHPGQRILVLNVLLTAQ